MLCITKNHLCQSSSKFHWFRLQEYECLLVFPLFIQLKSQHYLDFCTFSKISILLFMMRFFQFCIVFEELFV